VRVYTPQGATLSSWQWVRTKVVFPESRQLHDVTCTPYAPSTLVDLPVIPFDATVQLDIEVYGGAEPCLGKPTARGESLPFKVAANDADGRQIYVMVSDCERFVPTTTAVPAIQSTAPVSRRVGASATPLPDGRVVIIGGARLKLDTTDNPLESVRAWENTANIEEIYDTVEIYDPATGQFEALAVDENSAQTLFYRRAFHNAVYMPNSGLIAIIGGLHQPFVGTPIVNAPYIELFDPKKKEFLYEGTVGNLSTGRVGSTSTLLLYGTSIDAEYILVVGGEGAAAMGTYEVIALKAEGSQWIVPAANLPNPRKNHVAVESTRTDGKKLIFMIGGESDSGPTPFVDIFDKESGKFVEVPGFDAPAGLQEGGRVGHQAVFVPDDTGLLPEGIYVIGGYTDKDRTNFVQRIEVLNRNTGDALTTASQGFNLNKGRAWHSATLLPSGQILVAGGVEQVDSIFKMVTLAEMIGPQVAVDPTTGALVAQGDIIAQALPTTMQTTRFWHWSAALATGQAILGGGLVKLDNTVNGVGQTATDVGAEVITLTPFPLDP
jgi:hypothetical protein